MEHGFAGSLEPLSIQAGPQIELRAVSIDQAPALYALIDRNRGRLREWLPWVEWSYSLRDATTFVTDGMRGNASGDSLTTTIWFEDTLCGAIGLHAINRRHRSSSVGYWLGIDHEGRGIMTQACRAIVDEGFGRYGLHRIEIRCATGNSKSEGIPRRLGFVEEGILREAEWLYDHWVDLRVFSMLEQHWK
jgi:ribosomal-protein-serine acetyltransferase